MPTEDNETQSFHVKLPREGHEILKRVAKEQRRSLADVVRIALEEYLKKSGVEVDLSLERGGKR